MLVLRTRQLAALALTVTVLLGIPYLLVAVVTWPQLELSGTTIQVHLQSGRLPPGLGTTLLMAALWGVWALYLFAVATETAAWLRRGPVRLRRRPLGPLQVLAATALGTATTTGAASPALAETVATATDHHDTVEESPTPTTSEHEAEQETASGQEQRERIRVIAGFGYDSAEVTAQMRSDLEATLDLIAHHGAPDTALVITGHTDAAGDADYNQGLSERRAEAMADHFREALGEDAPPMETHGRGEDELLTDAGDSEQRRVEITYTITTPTPEETEAPPESGDEPVEADGPTEDTVADTDAQAMVVHLPSPAVTGLAAGAAAAAGAAGGYALGTRRRAPSEPEHRFATTAPAPEDTTTEQPEDLSESAPAAPPSRSEHHQLRQGEAAATLSPRVLASLANSPGIGLDGAEVETAAYALLTTALTTSDTAPAVRLVMCWADARHLLGEQAAALLTECQAPAVQLVESLPAALTRLHATLVERHHQLDHAEGDTPTETPTPGQEPDMPPVVLLTHPHPDHEADLSSLLLAAQGLNITAVILGRWPLGGTLTIEAGTITDTSPPLVPLEGAFWGGASIQHIQDLLTTRPTSPAHASADTIPPSPTPADDETEQEEEQSVDPSAVSLSTQDHHEDHHPAEPSTDLPAQSTDWAVPEPAQPVAPQPEMPQPERAQPPPPPDSESSDTDEPDSEPSSQDEAEETADTEHTPGPANSEHTPEPADTSTPEPPAATREVSETASAPETTPEQPAAPTPATPVIQLELMSRIRLTVENSRIELPRRHAYELAAYLAVHHADGVRLERAITDMWPDEDPRRTHRRVHDALRALRQTRRSSQTEQGSDPVIREAKLYHLNPELVAVDLWDLETALEEAEHTDDLARRHSLLQTVAQLYTADLAAEADYPWIEPVRTQLRHRVTHALHRHAEAVASDHPRIAGAVLDRAVDIDPDQEELHATRIRHHRHHGDIETARQAATHYTDHMRRLGLQPSDTMRELTDAIRGE